MNQIIVPKDGGLLVIRNNYEQIANFLAASKYCGRLVIMDNQGNVIFEK